MLKPSTVRKKNVVPRAPRSAEPGKDKRELILAAALEEFSQSGFAAARLDDVARRADVAKGTIYLYFKDKEALFQELLRAEISPVIAMLEASVPGFPAAPNTPSPEGGRPTEIIKYVHHAGFYKDPVGVVHLQGVVNSGTAGTIFQLPAGYRPAKSGYFPASQAAGVYAEATVNSNGNVGRNSFVSPSGSFYLEGITFRAAG